MPRRTYRKRYNKRRSYRRNFKRTWGRKRYNKRGQRVFYYSRYTGNFGSFTIANTVTTAVGFNFSLNDLPNYTEFTALYDMYKINAVKISFLPQMNNSVSIGSINNPNASARFFSAIDYNDASTPGSSDELRQYKTCKITPILKKHTRMIYKPKILTTNSFSISPWMATSSPSENYYGLRVFVEAMDSTSTLSMTYSVEAKYYLAFKNVK